MNHDATHCFNWTTSCPKTCYRAQLMEDLRRIDLRIPVSYAYLKYTPECPRWPTKPKEELDG